MLSIIKTEEKTAKQFRIIISKEKKSNTKVNIITILKTANGNAFMKMATRNLSGIILMVLKMAPVKNTTRGANYYSTGNIITGLNGQEKND